MKNYTRRDFTRHLGLAALFSPFLSMIEAQPARAAAGKAKYLLVFFTNGTVVAACSPKGSSENSISFTRSRVRTSTTSGKASDAVTAPTVPPVSSNMIPAPQAALPNIAEFMRM